LIVNAPDVLGNDRDVDGDALMMILVSAPDGTVTWFADGSFVYSPSVSFSGSDQFTYKANDGSADSNIATVTIPGARQRTCLRLADAGRRPTLPDYV
jgi:hypothetical protein